MRQDLVGDLGHSRKHSPDIEHFSNRAQQIHRALDAHVPSGFGQPLVRQSNGHIVGNPLRQHELALRIGILLTGQKGEDADGLAVSSHGHTDAGLEPSFAAHAVSKHAWDGWILNRDVIACVDDFGVAIHRGRIQPKGRAVISRQRKIRFIVHDNPPGNLAEILKHLAHIQCACHGHEQFVERRDPIRVGRGPAVIVHHGHLTGHP
jgi:hypothetical protein